MTDNGSALAAGFIPWEEITSAAIITLQGKRFLGIFLHNNAAVLARQPLLKRKTMETNLKMVGTPVTIPGHTSASMEEMLAPIQARLAQQQSSEPST